MNINTQGLFMLSSKKRHRFLQLKIVNLYPSSYSFRTAGTIPGAIKMHNASHRTVLALAGGTCRPSLRPVSVQQERYRAQSGCVTTTAVLCSHWPAALAALVFVQLQHCHEGF